MFFLHASNTRCRVSARPQQRLKPLKPRPSFGFLPCNDKFSPRKIVTKSKSQLDEDLEASSIAIDEMVRDVTRELLVDSAATYISGKAFLTSTSIYSVTLSSKNRLKS